MLLVLTYNAARDRTLRVLTFFLFILWRCGTQWEAAWQKHVESWEPVQGAESYISAAMINEDKSRPFPTEFELIEDPIPNVEVWCNNAYLRSEWKEFYANGTIDEYSTSVESKIYPCDVSFSVYRGVCWGLNAFLVFMST